LAKILVNKKIECFYLTQIDQGQSLIPEASRTWPVTAKPATKTSYLPCVAIVLKARYLLGSRPAT
jgi:hypothetical protein